MSNMAAQCSSSFWFFRTGDAKSEDTANKEAGEEKPEEDNDYHRSDEQVSPHLLMERRKSHQIVIHVHIHNQNFHRFAYFKSLSSSNKTIIDNTKQSLVAAIFQSPSYSE